MKNYIEKFKKDNEFKIIVEFAFLQFFFWSTWSIYGAYLVYYLGDIGYSNMRIGLMTSLRTFTGLIGPPVIGYLCDKIENRRKVFMLSMFIMALVITPFTFYGDLMIIIAIGMVGFLWEPQQSVLDSWILETSLNTADNYGFMRAWGSIGYAFTVTLFGHIIEKFGWQFHFAGYGIYVLMLLITAYSIKDNSYMRVKAKRQKLKKEGKELKSSDKNILRLFKNKEYIFILFIILLIFIPAMMVFVYLAPIIKSVGGDSTDLGYTLFFNALSEAPIFFAAKYFLKRFKTKTLLLFSASAYLLRIVIAAVAVSPTYMLFFGMMQSLSFGVFLVTVRYYVQKVAPDELKTTAQSIALMAGFGAGGIIASLLGGYLIDNFGLDIMLRAAIILSTAAILVLILSIIMDRVDFNKANSTNR